MIPEEGLTVLDGGVEGDTAVDYVFLHGLNGHPKNTWTYDTDTKLGSGFFWPSQILKDIPGCRVMTFGYNAAFERALVKNTTTINAIAQTFVARLIDSRAGEYINRPLVLIAHSLGGLVIKSALSNIHADRHAGLQTNRVKEQNAIYDSISGLVFMGTPHAGSHVADAGRIKVLKAIAGATFKRAPENLIKALSAHSNELQDLSRSFERTTIFTQHLIEICTYYETKGTKFVGEEVVPRAMAALHYLNEREEGIAKEHRAMAKFRDANDDTYRSICQRLKSMGSEGMQRQSARQANYRVSQIPSIISRADVGQFLADSGLGPASNMRVHSLAACLGVARESKTATITFTAIPLRLLEGRRQYTLQFTFKGIHGSLVIDTDFHGFTVLNDVQPEDHIIDCIAIPGLGYHPFSVWQREPESDPFMWLRDSLPQLVPGAQVLLYGYDPEFRDGHCPSSIEEIVISFISDLRSTGRSGLSAKPVIFLAHSLGGIVLKQCLVELAQSEMFMLAGVKGCVFLAVPNCLPGSLKLDLMIGSKEFGGLVAELRAPKNRGYLASLSSMVGGIAHANDFRLYSGYETVQTTFRNTESHLLLQRVEAIQEGSERARQFPIQRPHRSVPGLRAGSQTIDTIAGFVKDAVEATPAANTATTAVAQHRPSRLRSFARIFTSYFITSSAALGEMLIAPEDDINLPELRAQFISTLVAHGRGREEGIDDACPNTFDWVWSNPEIGLRSWLSDDNSLFWIRGKPGSGKSTIMRYIWDHQELAEALNDNPTDASTTIKAGFFFYYRGNHVQKSFEGLLHSILLHILEQEPRLFPLLLPEFAKLDPERRKEWAWNLTSLMKAYDDILTQKLFPLKLFIFLDALDEYDGPPESIVSFILSSVDKSSNGSTMLKLCLSSREWSIFEERFSGRPGFKIHEHTGQDIRNYISSRLSNHPTIVSRLALGTEQDRLDVQEAEKSLASRANGVFIWVRAVIDEIHHAFSRSSTTELLKYIASFPDDLDEFYAEAIQCIPHQHRMEAFFMFEILTKIGEMGPISLREITLCADLGRLADCISALQAHRSDSSASLDLDQWVKDRGAGLLEIALFTGDFGNSGGDVRFMHQTALDFVSRPGFRALLLDDHYSLPLENGYSFYIKWVFSDLQDIPARNHISDEPSFPLDVLALAELTTGRSMKKFIDDLDPRTMETILRSTLLVNVYSTRSLGPTDTEIAKVEKDIDQRLGFAVTQNLKILLHEYVQENCGTIRDDKPLSLLHCLSTLLRKTDIHQYYTLFPISSPSPSLDLTPFLLQHGVGINTVWEKKTPFQAVFTAVNYTKFVGIGGSFAEELPLNKFVSYLLEGGQDPNVDITMEYKKGRKRMLIICKALHVATRSMAQKLLEHGADINPIDSKGRTPLDLACGAGGNPFEMGDHVQPHDVYPLASLLISHGARLTAEGEKLWPRLLEFVAMRVKPLPDEFKNPGVISRFDPVYIKYNARKLKRTIRK